MREVKLGLKELTAAIDDGGPLATFYLDLETGEIPCITDELRSQMELISESYDDEQSQTLDWERAFEEEETPDWEREALKQADEIDAGLGERFLEIPYRTSDEGFREMQAFVDTVPDPNLQELLGNALTGRHVFRRFKDTLADYPAELEHWYQFREARLRHQALDWLEEEGITLLPGS
jgi:hypothetical protein